MSVGAWCFVSGWAHQSPTVRFLLLQHFSYFMLLNHHRCFISVFVWFLCSRRCCTDELEIHHADWINYLSKPRQNQGWGLWPRKIDLSRTPPPPPPPTTTSKNFLLTVPRQFIIIIVRLCNVCIANIFLFLFWKAVWPFCGKATVLLAFRLWHFHYNCAKF